MVTAPAGYGKTTLLRQSLAERHWDTAWIRCGQAERHSGRLVSRLVAEINRAVPGSAGSIVEALDSSQELPDPLATVQGLLAELDRLLVDPLVLVIDDAEHLARADGSRAVVDELLRAPVERLRVALSTRRPIGLRLARAKTQGRVREMGAGDLAFTSSECAEYIAATCGIALDEATLASLLIATEGWPLAVSTFVVSGAVLSSPTSLPELHSPASLKAFIVEEVIAALDADTFRALLQAAVPSRIGPAIAAAIGLPDGALANLRERGLFLRSSGQGSDTFGFHPMFREVLLELLDKEGDPDEVSFLHRRAAEAMAAEGDSIEAIDHWMAAGEWASAVHAMVHDAWSVASSSPDLVRSWIDRLPDATRATAAVQLLEGRLAFAAGDYQRASELLTASIDGGRLEDDPTCEWWARMFLADLLSVRGKLEEAVDVARGFDSSRARTAGIAAVATGMYAAHCLAALGRVGEAERMATVASEMPESAMVAPTRVILRAYLHVPAGRLDQARDEATAALERLAGDDPMLLRFNLMTQLAFVAAEQGRLEEAHGWWRRVGQEAESCLLAGRERNSHGFQALILAQLGRLDEASVELGAYEAEPTWIGWAHHLAGSLVAAGRGMRNEAMAAASRAVSLVRPAAPIYRVWAAVDLVPGLARVGADRHATEILDAAEQLLDSAYPGSRGCYLRARLLARKAWLAAERGVDDPVELVVRSLQEAGDSAPHLLRLDWQRISVLVSRALEDGRLGGPTVAGWLGDAFPDGSAVVSLLGHDDPEVRIAALAPALASGHPSAADAASELCRGPDRRVAIAAAAAIERFIASPPPRRFTTLGGFEVRIGERRIRERDWVRPVDARVVRFLLVRGDVPLPEDLLFEAFWPDLPPDRARRSLQVSASRIRRLVDHRGGSTSIIEAVHCAYQLRLGQSDTVDWKVFQTAAAAALKRPARRRALEHARSCWHGEPLPRERYSDWAVAWREQLVERYAAVLNALVSACDREHDHGAAIVAARQLLDLDSLDESAHRALMTSYARAGRRGRALRQFLACRRALADLGMEPDLTTSRLHTQILAGEPV